MPAGVVRTVGEVAGHRVGDDTCETFELIVDPHYAEAMSQRVLRFSAGTSADRLVDTCEELLFVTSGRGSLNVGGSEHDLGPGSAALVRSGETWFVTVAAREQLEMSSVLVPAPPGPAARSMRRPVGALRRLSQLGSRGMEQASENRGYEVLLDASTGCGGATQFIGHIPPSGAPAHYHLYDEICMIVRGTGVLHSNGMRQSLAAGSAFHVAPRLLHSVENTGDDDLLILGVFRPEGSPSAAYYPDGAPAPGHDDHP